MASAAPPPKMPIFDVQEIQQLTNTIEEPQHVMLLKIGYFDRHVKHPYPTQLGYFVLTNALNKTKVGTLRWFLLQSVCGFGAFHAPDVLNDYGRDAYQAIFDNAALATTPREQYVVRQSIRDAVFSIGTSLDIDRFEKPPNLDGLLLKAWQVNEQLGDTKPTDSHLQPIDWGRAIKRIGAQDKFIAIVETGLKDTTHPPDFSMLKLAVVVLQDKDPKRAIELLQTAQRKLLPDDIYNQKWLYQTWTQLITGQTPEEQTSIKAPDKIQLAALVEMRKDQISYTGTGYTDLLKLYWQLSQNDKAAELIKIISEPGIRAGEKINVASALLYPPADIAFSKDVVKQMQGQGVDLLQKYLLSVQENPQNPPVKKRTLEIKNELHARYLLGTYFMRQDLVTEESKALQTGDLKPPFHSSQSAAYYDQIVQMRVALEKKLSGVAGVH